MEKREKANRRGEKRRGEDRGERERAEETSEREAGARSLCLWLVACDAHFTSLYFYLRLSFGRHASGDCCDVRFEPVGYGYPRKHGAGDNVHTGSEEQRCKAEART